MGASPVLFQQGSDPTALSVLMQAITGQMGFMDADFCTTCGEKGAAKRCSICKMVNILDPLGRSDHNLVYLQLVYSFLWIKNFPQPQYMWGNGLISEALRVVFETTEWEVFVDLMWRISIVWFIVLQITYFFVGRALRLRRVLCVSPVINPGWRLSSRPCWIKRRYFSD